MESATPVVEKWRVFGAAPVSESTVSHAGRVVESTVKDADPVDVTAISALAGVPEPFV
jgi:hypothetical protein